MTDSNKSRSNKRDRDRESQAAFWEIMGNPFTTEEVEGAYNQIRRKVPLHAMLYGDTSAATPNGARPNYQDFMCDVEKALEEVVDQRDRLWFYLAYIEGDPTNNGLSLAQRTYYEIQLGRLFKKRKISPYKRYFKTIREKTNG